MTDELGRALEPVVRALVRREDIDRARRVERSIDSGGRVILDDQPWVRLRSPNGTLWSIRVADDGATKVTEE